MGGTQLGILLLVPNPMRRQLEVFLFQHAGSEVVARSFSNPEEGTKEMWKTIQKKERKDEGCF